MRWPDVPRAVLTSVGLAAAATLLAAFAAIPVVDAIEELLPAVVLVLTAAGLLHVGVGSFAPRPGWAMATPGPVLLAWLTWALWADLTARPGDGTEAAGGPGLAVAIAVAAVGFGLMFAGCILLGAVARRQRDAARASAAAAGLPPYP